MDFEKFLADLKAARAALQAEWEAILQPSQAENRNLTDEEQERFTALEKKVESKNAEIAKIEKILAGRRACPYPPVMRDGFLVSGGPTENRNELRTLRSNELLYNGGEEPMHVGRCLVAALTGRPDRLNETERRAMLGGLDSSGGYLLNSPLSGIMVDLARSASVCIKAGAQTLPMTTSELYIAQLLTDPVSHWRAETVAVQSSDLAFGKVVLRPRTLVAIVPISIELLEDVQNAETIIQSALQNSMAAAVDLACLVGTGTAEQPLGIRNTVGVNTQTSVGTPADYSPFSAAVGDILTDNYPGDLSALSWILHPRDGQVLDGLLATDSG